MKLIEKVLLKLLDQESVLNNNNRCNYKLP